MQTLPLLATLALLSCSTPPSSQPVSLSPTLYADAPVSAASGAESTTPNTSHAAAPKANQPSPVAGAALGDTADQVSRGLVPVAAGMPASTSAFVDRGATFEATVTSTDGTFKWIVNKAPKHPFALVAIEDAGNLIEPMHGAILADDGKIDSVPPKVVLMQASGQRLIVEYASGLRLELAPKGRALLIDAAQKTGKRTQGQLDFSQGGVKGNAPSARVLCVPYMDIAGVVALRLADQTMRYLTTWLDPAQSNATLILGHKPGMAAPGGEVHYGQLARYKPSTEGERLPLVERIWISWTQTLAAAMPSMERSAAPGVERAADLFFVSISEPDFPAATEAVQAIAAQGVAQGRDALGLQIIMHQWQHDGYDTGYPNAVMPPNPKWGGLEGLLEMRAATAQAGYPFGVHHNWMFNSVRLPGESMLDSDGSPVTSDQGGHYLKPRKAVELVDEVEGEMHTVLKTSGVYSDSMGASLPRADSDAKNPDWGRIAPALDKLGRVVASLRAIHGAPITSEGSLGFGHVIWSGMFDAFPGQVFWQTEPTALEQSGRFADVVPDFAWGRLHRISVREGVGPPLRYVTPAGTLTPGYKAADRDLQQTMASVFGATGFHWWFRLSVPGDVARDWWSAAPLREALADPARPAPSFAYLDAKNQPHTLNAWLAKGRSLAVGDVHLRVSWPNGDRILANLTEQPWTIDGQTLAPMGSVAEIGSIKASILATQTGVIERLIAEDYVYLDARGTRQSSFGLTTDGAVGARRADRAWHVYPLREYTLNLPTLDTPERVEWTELTLGAEFTGGAGFTVEWFDAAGRAILTETKTGAPWRVTREQMQQLDAASFRVRAE